MLEIIKEAGTILKDLPELAIWILLGILFYKVVIVGSIFGIIKLAINSAKEVAIKPKEKIIKYDIGKKFIKTDGAHSSFMELLDLLNSGVSINSDYVHRADVDFLVDAYKEKLEKDGYKHRKKS